MSPVSWRTTWATCWLGMAKPTPMLPASWPRLALAVRMPTTSPAVLTIGPPELPGLIGASVWMASLIAAPD